MFPFKVNDRYPFHDIHEKLIRYLESRKIPALDLRAAYWGIPAERLQVIPGTDSHPNEIAHRIASEEIYTWLTKEKLVPDELHIHELFSQRGQAPVPIAESALPARFGLESASH